MYSARPMSQRPIAGRPLPSLIADSGRRSSDRPPFSPRSVRVALSQGLEGFEPHGRESRNRPADGPHSERQQQAQKHSLKVDRQSQHHELAASAAGARDDAGGGPAVSQVAERAAQRSADQGNQQ